jgi:hypothetical protein
LLATSCSDKDKLVIFGKNKIDAYFHHGGEEQYQTIDRKQFQSIDGQ